MTSDLLNQKEASQVLGVSVPTLRRMEREGQVQGVQIGRRTKYRRSELEAILRGETNGREEEAGSVGASS